jgi:carboxyl-terminal processing protease
VSIACLLLCILLARPAHAETATPGPSLDQALVADVTATGLAFMAPRTLEAIPIPQMTIWGLRGLTTLDPRLTAELQRGDSQQGAQRDARLRGGNLRLLAPDRVLLSGAAPPDGDARAWGEAAAELTRAAWNASEPVRRAGTASVIRSFFDELFNHMDAYSRYAGPDEAEADRARRVGRAGVGLQVAGRGTGFVVVGVVADSPGAQADIRPGDAILAVDGRSIRGLGLMALNALLAGPEGTAVTLTTRRGNRTQTLELARALVPPETVFAQRMAEMLVLRVSGFSRDTGARLAEELVHGLAGPRPPRGVVIDLRGNRGGLLIQAVAAAEVVLAEGLVASTAGRDPAAAHEFRAAGRDLSDGLPVVVVVDGRSASAAEILAAALADQHRAVVIGSATLGKGLVQTVTPLPDGGELFVTWSRVLAPMGWPIQGLGVLPQVCTSLGQDALASQLQELAHGHQPMARALERSRTARAPLPPAEMLEIRSACPASEGRDMDLATARPLIDVPAAYATALIGPPSAALSRSGPTAPARVAGPPAASAQ